MARIQFDWDDYDMFENRLGFYLQKGRREFNYRDFFSTPYPDEAEYKRFDEIFKMALTAIGGLIQSKKTCPGEDNRVVYIVSWYKDE